MGRYSKIESLEKLLKNTSKYHRNSSRQIRSKRRVLIVLHQDFQNIRFHFDDSGKILEILEEVKLEEV